MIKEVFDLDAGTAAAELFTRYTNYKKSIEALEISQRLIDTFCHVLNEAYDRALDETNEAQEAASSPRASPRRLASGG